MPSGLSLVQKTISIAATDTLSLNLNDEFCKDHLVPLLLSGRIACVTQVHTPNAALLTLIASRCLEADYLPTPMLASVGALVLFGVGSTLPLLIAAGAGALLGAALSRVMHEQHATRVSEQLERDGLLLWVNVRTALEEETALQVLRSHSAHDVHAHEIAL